MITIWLGFLGSKNTSFFYVTLIIILKQNTLKRNYKTHDFRELLMRGLSIAIEKLQNIFVVIAKKIVERTESIFIRKK